MRAAEPKQFPKQFECFVASFLFLNELSGRSEGRSAIIPM